MLRGTYVFFPLKKKVFHAFDLSFLKTLLVSVHLKDGVVDTVELSSKIHDFWFPEIENFAVWRYVAFANGVLRITPGTELQKDYNPTERNW